MSERDEVPIASDGLPARAAGAYARDKLAFLDEFGPPALQTTRTKLDRVFVDLFAGPGMNVVKGSTEEFAGSPLRVAGMEASRSSGIHFTRGIFCNIDEDCHTALTERLRRLAVSGRCRVPQMESVLCDSNESIRSILATIHPRAYIFAFADIEGVQQLPWSTIHALRERHLSVDLYVLVPVEMSFNRLLGTDPEHRARHAPVLTEYFGHERWLPVAEKWKTDALGGTVRRELLELYRQGLREKWEHADVVEVARLSQSRLLYRMIFATQHPAAKRIADWAAERQRGPQGELGL